MSKVVLLRDFCRDMAKAVHHTIKQPDQATTFLEQAYEQCHELLATSAFPAFGPPIALPPGAADPLALPEEEPGDA